MRRTPAKRTTRTRRKTQASAGNGATMRSVPLGDGPTPDIEPVPHEPKAVAGPDNVTSLPGPLEGDARPLSVELPVEAVQTEARSSSSSSGTLGGNSQHNQGARTAEFLGFCLGSEEYAVGIRAVREIIKPPEVTTIPRCTPEIVGLISLRGAIIPIVNIRRRLGLTTDTTGGQARIIVFSVETGAVGILVDRVTEVISADPSTLEQPPATLSEREAAFVPAVLRARGRLIGILDLERLVTMDSSSGLRAVA